MKRLLREVCSDGVEVNVVRFLHFQVRYEPEDGHFLLTSSYDNTSKVWGGNDFKRVTTLSGHEAKVMGSDVARGGEMVTTVSYDRTMKIWVQNPEALDGNRTQSMQIG